MERRQGEKYLTRSWEEWPPFCNLMTSPSICSHRTSHLVTRCPIGHLRDHQRIAVNVRSSFLPLSAADAWPQEGGCETHAKDFLNSDRKRILRRVGDGCVRKVNTRFFYDYYCQREKRGAILLHTGNGNRAIKMDLKMSGMPEPQSNREESQSSELPVGEKCTVGWETWH